MASGNDALLGRVAVAMKLLSDEQVRTGLREQSKSSKNLGDVFVETGLLTSVQLARLVKTQQEVLERAEAKRRANAAASLQSEPMPEVSAAWPTAPPPGVAADAGDERLPGLEGNAHEGSEPTPTPRPAPTPPTATAAWPATPAAAAKRSATAVAARVESPTSPGAKLDHLLRQAVDAGASDLHVHSGSPIRLRRHGALYDHGSPPLSAPEAEALVFESLGAEDRALFEKWGELDYPYEIPDLARFRVNAYRQLHGTDAVFRVIPKQPPSLADLGLPQTLARLVNYHQGMVLVTGPTRCGKSATLAALVNLINEERPEHVLTIEDPIEYVHVSKRSLVNQRSVRRHTETFARALRAALREDPDIIVIGELRDRETIALALTAAETGHFVLGTMHTDNTIRTLNRLVGAFPPDQQDQVRAMLSGSLRAVVSQRLLPTADEQGVVVALETMIVNRAIGNLLRESKTVQIRSLLQTGASQGMGLLEQSMASLVSEKRVSREEALRHAEDPKLITG